MSIISHSIATRANVSYIAKLASFMSLHLHRGISTGGAFIISVMFCSMDVSTFFSSGRGDWETHMHNWQTHSTNRFLWSRHHLEPYLSTKGLISFWTDGIENKGRLQTTHGYKRMDIPTPPTVEKHGEQWLVAFSPVVAGCHLITITIETEIAGNAIDRIMIEKRESIQPGDEVLIGMR